MANEATDDVEADNALKAKYGKRQKLPDATYVFSDGSKVRGRTDESVVQIKARHAKWYGGTMPDVVDEIRDPDRRGREDED